MSSPVEQIKERLSIEEVVSSYIKLDRAGSNLKAKCPFHNEKTPSFFISPDRGTYYCFGCGASGDIFSFVEEFEGLDFKGALTMLADRAGVKLERFSKEKSDEKDKLYQAMEEATGFFAKNLEANKEALDYLKSRGLADKDMADFRIGFARDGWRDLYDHLRRKNFSDMEIEKAGLAKKSEKGMYDRFRNRIIFPISDSSGRVVAFSGRLFTDDGKSAKYLNSPETPIFSKSAILYGLDKAKDSIRKNNFSILVEGQMDLILSHQAGFRNTIATSGTALSDSLTSKENVVSNLGLVRRLSQNLLLAFDSDKAGLSATERAGKIALSLGMDVKVANIAPGMDPADLISKEGKDAWKNAVKNSKHIIEFLLHKNAETFDDQRKLGRVIKDRVLPFVAALSSAIEQAHFVKAISDKTSIPESAIREDLKDVEQEEKKGGQGEDNILEKQNLLRRRDYIERKLLGIIFWQEGKGNSEFNDKIIKELAEIVKKPHTEILKNNNYNKDDLIFEAEVFYNDASFEDDARELILNLEGEYLKDALGSKMAELGRAEEAKDRERSALLLKEIAEINKRTEKIKSGRVKK